MLTTEDLRKDMDIKFSIIESKLEGKVGYTIFWSVFGMAMTVVVSLFGYISTQIKDLQEKSFDIKSEVSQIGGILDGYNITIQE